MLRPWRQCLAATALGLCGVFAGPGTSAVARDRPRQDEPATTQSAADPQALARRLVALGDSDPAVREAARRQLLSMRVDDLAQLPEAIRLLPEGAAASPSLALTLRDALVHIHLRDAKNRLLAQRRSEIGLGDAFLGVSLGGDPWNRNEDSGLSGVSIRGTMPGFVAYETLEEGDRLVGMRTSEGLERLVNYRDLRNAFYRLAPGDHVEFLVMRGGRILRIPLVIDERLATLPGVDEQWSRMEATAKRAAETFWEENLSPLLSRGGRTTAQAD